MKSTGYFSSYTVCCNDVQWYFWTPCNILVLIIIILQNSSTFSNTVLKKLIYEIYSLIIKNIFIKTTRNNTLSAINKYQVIIKPLQQLYFTRSNHIAMGQHMNFSNHKHHNCDWSPGMLSFTLCWSKNSWKTIAH